MPTATSIAPTAIAIAPVVPIAPIAMTKRFAAELMGTMWLVFGGCRTAVLAAKFPETGVGFLGVALAFGLTVLTMVAAIGGTSGAHLTPDGHHRRDA